MIDDKLNLVVDKIERSALPDEEKAEVYDALLESMVATVKPILSQYAPEDKMAALGLDPEKDAVSGYGDIMDDIVKNPAAKDAVETALDALLVKTNAELAKQGIQ